ncbi:FG-GAP repeat domain-containing protein [Reichenbachiella ulvae]|uniref:FG-GAP-like repeat-containing protein n=1 Tax=Reichenbachiella ulvae TaxID=2980104 RepID=A0ABT3CPP8_9BACT|nr:FG-GAP-like repeat-containing protein [Reichenbachiella ulvae]MCV9385698.1 FG-GAP-like repeat-containing protein [Reichenbachiella ulvae]
MKKLPNLVLSTLLLLIVSLSCSKKSEKRSGKELYTTYCASCHQAVEIQDLPKKTWDQYVLPEMAAKMGIREEGYNPYEGMSYRKMEATIRSGQYPTQAMLSQEEWRILREYIIQLAPDSVINDVPTITETNLEFKSHQVNLDDAGGAYVVRLGYDQSTHAVLAQDLSGRLFEYDFLSTKRTLRFDWETTVIDYTKTSKASYLTEIGVLNPSEEKKGRLIKVEGDTTVLVDSLHRPVHTLVRDLNNDGELEFVISEFGHLTGQLSLLKKDPKGQYVKEALYGLPGVIRVIAKDMNQDGNLDLIFVASQAREGIYVLYQEENLTFSLKQLVSMSPVYGISWFELLDFDGDGDLDIVTVNGDNADYSVVLKPYHGMRIYLNQGENNFDEAYFYPMNGATRVKSGDFDQDGDWDFALMSTFPDYGKTTDQSIIYLENKDTEGMEFVPSVFPVSNEGRWLVMESADVDQDGDEDLIFGSFTYTFSPVPELFTSKWANNSTDLLVLENLLRD